MLSETVEQLVRALDPDARPILELSLQGYTTAEIGAYYAARVPGLKQTVAKEWRGACPVHHGRDANFSVDPRTGLASCHSRLRSDLHICVFKEYRRLLRPQ